MISIQIISRARNSIRESAPTNVEIGELEINPENKLLSVLMLYFVFF